MDATHAAVAVAAAYRLDAFHIVANCTFHQGLPRGKFNDLFLAVESNVGDARHGQALIE
jgi:hypothetical protein